jgi:putative acetyltransferase
MTRKIRLFRSEDTDQIAYLFHTTVRQVNIRDYSSDRVIAWAPDDLYFRNWESICSQRITYVAEENGIVLGFGELEANGHIGCFYCHKDYQRCGVGSQIYRAIEAKAEELGLKCLFTEASITAKPFFQRMGFEIIREQQVSCRGAVFINYAMEKRLNT